LPTLSRLLNTLSALLDAPPSLYSVSGLLDEPENMAVPHGRCLDPDIEHLVHGLSYFTLLAHPIGLRDRILKVQWISFHIIRSLDRSILELFPHSELHVRLEQVCELWPLFLLRKYLLSRAYLIPELRAINLISLLDHTQVNTK
jgi:hypothetical protein